MTGHEAATLPVVAPLPPVPERAVSAEPAEQRFLIRNIDWTTYQTISEALNGRHYYMSFDGKDLELMTISDEHAQCRGLMRDFVVVLTEETGQPRRTSGDMTMNREDLKQGIESDESFYITNAPKVQRRKINLAVDPPPDLAIEVDLTTDLRRRLGIYAQIGVPEIWSYDGSTASIFQRQADGKYAAAEKSRYFAFLTAAVLSDFLGQRGLVDEDALLLSFRKWVRQQAANG